MVKKRFLYLTLSCDGIWYYQRWMPKHFRLHNPKLKPLFRVSLRTKNKAQALHLSHIMSLKIDQLALDFFETPEDFGQAMTLLAESARVTAENPSYEYIQEHLIDSLNGADKYLLSKAERFEKGISSKFKSLEDQITALQLAIKNNTSTQTPEGNAKLLKEISEIITPELPNEQNPTVEDLSNKWLTTQKSNVVRASYQGTYEPGIKLFIRFVNDFKENPVRINNLSAEHIRYYQKHYANIPKRTRPSNYTIAELIQLKGDSKSPKTIHDNFSIISTFFNWVEANAYPIDGRLSKVLMKGSNIKLDDKSKMQRAAYSDQELKTIFNSQRYTETGKFNFSAIYWVGLITLFTGARMSEILQLENHDISKKNDTWVISFDDIDHDSTDPDKHVKEKSSRRIVPIHKQLIKLGFIKYVESKKGRLFEDEPRDKDGKFKDFSKRHRTYRHSLNVKPSHSMEYKDFHSFRHTVRTRLTEIRSTGHVSQRFDEGIIDAIVGHASKDRSIGQTTYNHSQQIAAKKKALDRLEFPSIDFEKIISWEKCVFARKKHRQKAKAKLKR